MFKFAFVLEQTMGHVAHSKNLIRAVAAEPDIEAITMPIEYTEAQGFERLPGVRTWSWRASTTARSAVLRRLAAGPLDGLFIHTQTAALKAADIMRDLPTIVSLDATPRQFDREGEAYGHHRDVVVIEAMKQRIVRRAFLSATRLVTWCNWAAYSLVAEYEIVADKIDVIPPGVNLDLFRPLLTGKDNGAVRVLFVGSDFERKGGRDLVEAVRVLGGKVEIDLVTRSRVTDLPAGMTIRIHSDLEPQSDRLIDLYRRAHIFALPSRGDCMPQAVTEALACGLPVVATRVGAIPEMVYDGRNGYLVPTRDPRAIAQAIGALARTPTQRTRMGHASRRLAEQQYNASVNNRRIFELMRRIADEREVLTAGTRSA